MIIGVTGKKGHGKDTVGQFIVNGADYKQIAYADPIKEAVKIALSMTDAQVYGSIAEKETVDPRYNITPRYAMQTLGTEWGRDMIHRDVWAISLHARIDREPPELDWVVTDLRFLNEEDILKQRGGLVIKVVRKGVDTGEFENHPSERSIDLIKPHVLLHNSGSLYELQMACRFIASAIQDNADRVREKGIEISVGGGWARNLWGEEQT